MLGNDKMETASTEFTLILKLESTSKFPLRIDVIISTWICLSKWMKSRQTFHVEFRRQIDEDVSIGFRSNVEEKCCDFVVRSILVLSVESRHYSQLKELLTLSAVDKVLI